jgi:secretion/DNA translocation related CpaE-like protein
VALDASPTVIALTGDAALADELQRLAAAAGVGLVVLTEVPSVARWPQGLVLVGADLARAVSRRGASRAAEVVVVGLEIPAGGSREERLWQHAVAAGAEQVALLPQAHAWLIERLARTVEPTAPARVVGVVGGCGGAGATMLAATLAVASAEAGRRTLLVDVDQLGGGIDVAVRLDDVPGLRWPDLASARGRLPVASLHASLPRAGAMAVLGWGRGDPIDLPPAAVESVLEAARRGHDLVVVDLPRALDPVAEAALCRVDDLLVVVPARLRAVAAAGQLVASVGGRAASTRVVVRRGANEHWTARQVADALDLPLAAQVREEARIEADLERGILPGQRARSALRRAAEQCLTGLVEARAA